LTAKLEQILKYRRSESEFECDGIVVTDNSKTYTYDNNSNPKSAMAFKKNVDMKETVVKGVTWDVSRYGVLTPVLQIETVRIGVRIYNVTGHNAKIVHDNNIGKGSKIRISRSGDVIPKLEEVLSPSTSGKPDMPDAEYEWNETEVDILIVNPSQEYANRIQMKKNLHFFRKLEVKYLSEGILTNLHENGYTTVRSILEAADEKDQETYDLSGLGEKMMVKIYGEIDKAMEKPELYKFMSASDLFGMGIGIRKLRDLIKAIPDFVEKYANSKSKDIVAVIVEVKGFSNISAVKIANGLKPFIKFVKDIRSQTSYLLEFKSVSKVTKTANIKNIKNIKPAKGGNVKATKTKKSNEVDDEFTDRKVVMTGFRDQFITDFIEDKGGEIANSVSGKTYMVIFADADKAGNKLTKAKDLGIVTISMYDFRKKYLS
jgi:DNA ligase (NAD+)